MKIINCFALILLLCSIQSQAMFLSALSRVRPPVTHKRLTPLRKNHDSVPQHHNTMSQCKNLPCNNGNCPQTYNEFFRRTTTIARHQAEIIAEQERIDRWKSNTKLWAIAALVAGSIAILTDIFHLLPTQAHKLTNLATTAAYCSGAASIGSFLLTTLARGYKSDSVRIIAESCPYASTDTNNPRGLCCADISNKKE